MNDTLLNGLINTAVVAVIAGVLWSKLKRRRGTTEDISALARSLGFAPRASGALDGVAPEVGSELESNSALRAGAAAMQFLPGARTPYEGTVDGVRVTMALSAEGSGRNVQSLFVEFFAHPPSPWTVGLAMAREHAMDHLLQPGRQAQDIKSGDAAFDRDVFVRADRPEQVLGMLRAPTLREKIHALITTQPRSWLDDAGVHVRLSGTSPAPAVVRPLLQDMTTLVRAIDQALA